MSTLRIGDWLVEPDLGRISTTERDVRLEPRVFELLSVLAASAGTVVTKDTLFEKLWGGSSVVDDVLTRAVSQLRLALGDDPRAPRFIETIPKRGYRLIAPVERIDSRAETRGIVVLPFKDISRDGSMEHVALGVTELLTGNLSRIQSLRTISRTSAVRCANRDLLMPQIARELHVDFVVEGAVAGSGDELLVLVKLIDAAADAHLWSREFRGGARDILLIQTEAARAIAREIAIELTPGEVRMLSSARPVEPRAHDFYLRGLYNWSKRSPAALQTAIACFERAAEEDPGSALAEAALANCFVMMVFSGLIPVTEGIDRAAVRAKRALALDDDLGEAHTAYAGVQIFRDLDWAGSERSLRRAIALSPSSSLARRGLAGVLGALGRHQEALHHMTSAVAMNPFDVGMVMDHGEHLVFARRAGEAIAPLERAVEMEPQLPRPRERLIRALALAGRPAEALQQLEKAKHALALDSPALEALVLALAGRRTEAERVAATFDEQPKLLWTAPLDVAAARATLDQRDEAFRWLSRAANERIPQMAFLAVDPALDRLRQTAPFDACLRSMHLPKTTADALATAAP